MEKQIIYVGGGDSYSNRTNFLKALKTQEVRDFPKEEKKGWKHSVREQLGTDWYFDIPQMPNRNNANYDEWKIWFERHLDRISDSVILIGCSLGAMFLAKYLIEEVPEIDITALFLLAGPCGTYEDGNGNDCGSFQFDPVDLSKIAKKIKNITIMHSTDDFVVPYEHALKYKEALPEAELVTFEDKNHFLVEELPELVERIKGLS